MTDYRQNQTLFQQYQVSRDRKTRDLLFKVNEKLIHSVVSRFSKFGWEYDDFYQIGAIGLLKAIDRFEPSKGGAFSSFAMPCIRGEILHYVRDRFSPVKISRLMYTLYRKGDKFVATHRQNTGRNPTEKAILEHLGVTAIEWRDAVFANAKPESLDVLLPDSEDAWINLLPAPEKPGLSMDELESLLNTLDDRHAVVIREYYLKNRTNKSIALDFGVAQTTIDRWRKEALRSLRASIGNSLLN